MIDFGASPMPVGEAAPWMVLEWLHGITLEQDFDSCRGHGRPPAEVLSLLRPVLDALVHAHDEGIAHRDIKPGNIMLVANRRNEVTVKLLDFGIAKSMAKGERASGGLTATRSGLPAFSPLYAAPEQLSGARTGPWTDVHAMALVLCEALLGGPVYSQDDSTALYAEVLSPVRPTPAKFGVDIGPWEPVLQRALAVRPDQRYGHMRELVEALTGAFGVAAPGPVAQADLDPAEWEDATAQLSRAAVVAPGGIAVPSSALPLAIAPTYVAATLAGPVPSTFQPVTQTVGVVEEAPTARWKLWAAVAVLGAGIGAVAFGARMGPTTRATVHVGSEAPVTPVVIATPAPPRAPVVTQAGAVGAPRETAAVVARPGPGAAPVVRRAMPAAPTVAVPIPAPAPAPAAEPGPTVEPPAAVVAPTSAAEAPTPAPAEMPAEPEAPVVRAPVVRRTAAVVRPALAPVPAVLEAPVPRPAPVRPSRRLLHHTEIPLQ